MKNRLHWFVHDIIAAVTWVAIFVGYYFLKLCDAVGETLFGDTHGRR